MTVRWHVWFSGRVQGVGFRFTCVQQSKRHDVAGWVKNLIDGQVEMVVEGTPQGIENYLQDVAESTYGRVDKKRVIKSAATGEFFAMSVVH